MAIEGEALETLPPQPNATHGTTASAQSADCVTLTQIRRCRRRLRPRGAAPGIMVPSVPFFFSAVPARARRYMAAALSTRLLRGGSHMYVDDAWRPQPRSPTLPTLGGVAWRERTLVLEEKTPYQRTLPQASEAAMYSILSVSENQHRTSRCPIHLSAGYFRRRRAKYLADTRYQIIADTSAKIGLL